MVRTLAAAAVFSSMEDMADVVLVIADVRWEEVRLHRDVKVCERGRESQVVRVGLRV